MNELEINEIIQILKKVTNKKDTSVALHEPYFRGHELAYLRNCIDTSWVSYSGEYVTEFEKKLENFTGVKYAVVVVSGTVALFLCLKMVGINTDDEVLLPSLTFVATANAVANCGAIPHFIDANEQTLGVDPTKLAEYLGEIAQMRSDGCYNKQTHRRIRALIAVHVLGHPVDLDPLVKICSDYGLTLIEDAAESLGSYYKGIHTGNWGEVSALSFNGNKIVTTGGGGAVLTNNEELARHIRHISATAKLPHKWAFLHDMVAYNFRMPNINAALGCAQMEQLETFLSKKRALALKYKDNFSHLNGLKIFQEADFAKSNYWLNALILNSENASYRDQILAQCHTQGIYVRPLWTPLHELPMYTLTPRMPDLSTTYTLHSRTINIPSSAFL